MTASSLLAAGIAIIIRQAKMLVWETPEGYLELPGFIFAKAEEAGRSIEELLAKLKLGDVPQQTLYLISITLPTPSKKVPALVRVIHLKKVGDVSFPHAFFESLLELQTSERASNLVSIVARWMT